MYIITGSWEAILPSYQRKLGSNTSELRVTFTWWNWPWWRAVWDFTSHSNTSQKNWPWWRAVWDFTSHNNTSQKNWPWWRAVCDFTLHSNTSQKNWPAWLLSSGVAMCVERCRFATGCCKTHCNGCMNVAWALFCGGSRSTKPCVFPCKVAAAGGRIVTVASSCFGCACVCVVIGCFGTCGCRSHWTGCMKVACSVLWGGSRGTKPCVFPCKVAAALHLNSSHLSSSHLIPCLPYVS